MINKIKKAINDGSFLLKAIKKIHYFNCKFLVTIFIHNKDKENISFNINFKFYKFYKKIYKLFLNKKCNYDLEFFENERIIWWSWLQGEDKAPDLCKACLKSLRKNLSNFEIKIITENNMSSYIEIPDFILLKYKKGYIGPAHFSDIIRTLLLIKYGGVWIDSTVYCTGYNEDLFSAPLFYYSNIMRGDNGVCGSNWLISSCKNNPVLCTTRDLLFNYWKKHNFASNYYIYHIFFHLALEKYSDLWNKVSVYSNIPPHILQTELFKEYTPERFEQYKKMSDFHKLTYKIPVVENLENSNFNKIIEDL